MTGQDTVAKTAPLAMYAVAQHMIDRRLPSPRAIRAPRPGVEDARIRIDVYTDDLESWVQATAAAYLSSETRVAQDGARVVIVRFVGRVPSAIGDVAVVIRIAQRVHTPSLELVPGGVA